MLVTHLTIFFIGHNAGYGGSGRLTDSVAIGRDALMSTGANAATGIIAIGYNALTDLTTGASNLAIGYQAMLTHTTGHSKSCYRLWCDG